MINIKLLDVAKINYYVRIIMVSGISYVREKFHGPLENTNARKTSGCFSSVPEVLKKSISD